MNWQYRYSYNFTPKLYRKGCAAALWLTADPLMRVIIRICQIVCIVACVETAFFGVRTSLSLLLTFGVCFFVGVGCSPFSISWVNYILFLCVSSEEDEETPFGPITVTFTPYGMDLRSESGQYLLSSEFSEMETEDYLIYLCSDDQIFVLPKELIHHHWLRSCHVPAQQTRA